MNPMTLGVLLALLSRVAVAGYAACKHGAIGWIIMFFVGGPYLFPCINIMRKKTAFLRMTYWMSGYHILVGFLMFVSVFFTLGGAIYLYGMFIMILPADIIIRYMLKFFAKKEDGSLDESDFAINLGLYFLIYMVGYHIVSRMILLR